MTMYDQSDVQDAFHFFLTIMDQKKIVPGDRQPFSLYKKDSVREVLEDVIEPIARVKFVQLDSTRAIYVIPGFDNEWFRYSNEELRSLWKLANNQELYIVQFSMLILLSMFYNRDTSAFSERSSVSLVEYEKQLSRYIDQLKQLNNEEIDSLSEDVELDLKSVVELWEQKMLIVETAKHPERAKSGKLGMLNRVLRFLEAEELLMITEDGEIRLLEKMNAMVLRYYFNESRREQLFDFLKKSVALSKGE